MVVTVGVMALLQSSVEVEELSSEMKVYYLASPKKSLTKEKGLKLLMATMALRNRMLSAPTLATG